MKENIVGKAWIRTNGLELIGHIDAFKKKIGNNVKLVIVDANINEKAFSETVAHEVLLLAHE